MSSRWSFRNSSSGRSYSENGNVSSAFMTAAYESSNNFFTGDYEHNLEVMDNLNSHSIRDDVDEDRLIYLATKKFAKESDYQSRRQIVVSSEELHASSATRYNSEGSEIERTSGMDQIRNIFMIFKGDDSYMEVSREEIQRVRVMHKRFQEGSEFCFNYNALLILASIIAALGLGGNSTATIIASMLVSPLMGPVMGMAYGATILDFKLFCIAFQTELVSLIACIGVGAIVGGCMIPFFDLSSDPEEWPSDEMNSRANMRNFFIGIPIAFASGLGVAVSVLDEQTSSLVGVAISASLLPPAINAGMLWTTYFFDRGDTDHHFGNEGLVSLALTLVNILMIILSSMLMFRIKERLPIKNKRVFWTDLGLARKIYQNLAIYNSDEDGPMRRIGRRVSMMFASSDNFGNDPNNRSATRTSVAAPDNQEMTGTNLSIPRASEDSSEIEIRPRALSTVPEEERLSGYYSS